MADDVFDLKLKWDSEENRQAFEIGCLTQANEDAKEIIKILRIDLKWYQEECVRRDRENDRIDKIVDHFTLDDMPVIKFILNISENREDLKKVGKALDRVADLIEARNELVPKLKIIELAEKDPNWFALTFGDFSVDVDLELDNILGDLDV
jgi:hypothetical protein